MTGIPIRFSEGTHDANRDRFPSITLLNGSINGQRLDLKLQVGNQERLYPHDKAKFITIIPQNNNKKSIWLLKCTY